MLVFQYAVWAPASRLTPRDVPDLDWWLAGSGAQQIEANAALPHPATFLFEPTAGSSFARCP